jgi:putative ABC transport system substrate-binding protein
MALVRRRFLLAACGVLGFPVWVMAQPAKRVYRVGLLSIGSDQAAAERWQPFLDGMRELEYVEGQNLVVLRGFGESRAERMDGFIAEFLRAKVDVIVVTGTREIRAAKKATSTIPIVMTLANDPVKEGFIASLARPGGNVTGLTSLVPGLPQKYVELLLEVVPGAKRFAVVATPPNPTAEIRHEIEVAAKSRGIAMAVLQAKGPSHFDRVMEQARKDGADGIIHPLDGGTSAHKPALVQAALKHRLPGIYGDAAYVDAGGLMTYSVSFALQLRRAVVYVDKILRGANPADLPVELPMHVEMVVNLKTAKALGIRIPESILLRADRTIE